MSENNNQSMGDLFPDLGPEVPIISGVAHDSTESLATVRRVPNEPGMAAKVFTTLRCSVVFTQRVKRMPSSSTGVPLSFMPRPSSVILRFSSTLRENWSLYKP